MMGVALAALFAFSATVAASASAVEFLLAEWLINGSPVTTTTASKSEGELELVDTKTSVGEAKLLCSGVLDGTVGPNGEDSITELLSLSGTAISLTALSGTALTCTGDQNCGSPKVWAVHLPWKTLLELMEDEGASFFVDLIESGTGGSPGWYAECTVIVKIEDECTGTAAVNMTNEAGGVDGLFEDPFNVLAGLKLATCTQGGAETGIVNGLGTTTVATGTLSVSE